MPTFHIHAIGQLKSGPEYDLCREYEKRLRQSVRLFEYAFKDKVSALRQEKESKAIYEALAPQDYLILLDEKGKTPSTLELSDLLQEIHQVQGRPIAFAIGGADGHTHLLRQRAQYTLSFGRLTWPHKLVRALLMEQLYRCQQIQAGHPYHRE